MFDIASFLDPRVKDSEQFTLEDGTADKIKQLMTDVLIPQDKGQSAACTVKTIKSFRCQVSWHIAPYVHVLQVYLLRESLAKEEILLPPLVAL